MALMIRQQWSTITSPEYLFALKLPIVIRFWFAFASTVSYLTLGRTRKFIAPPLYKGGGGVDGNPPHKILICCSISKRIFLQWKAFDLLKKIRYIFGVVALLEACDVTNNDRHLGFYQELEITLKPRVMVFFVLDMKNNINKPFA